MKNCRTCTYYPCLKVQCSIGNKEGCEDYQSIVTTEIKKKVDDYYEDE